MSFDQPISPRPFPRPTPQPPAPTPPPSEAGADTAAVVAGRRQAAAGDIQRRLNEGRLVIRRKGSLR